MNHRRALGALLLPLSVLVACASNAVGTGGTGGTGGGGTGASDSICSTDPRAMVYAIGLTATAMDGKMKASFVDATPAPPSKNENSWTLKVIDASGNPISGAAITAKPFMPDHGHGASVVPTITSMTDGTYEIANLDLFMPGIWTVTLTITPTSGPVDTVVFSFCIDG
jgi:hypothetical protein